MNSKKAGLLEKITVLLATGFGLGYSPFAPGTVGSLPGVILVWFVNARYGLAIQVALAILLAAAAIPICSAAERHFGQKDDHRIVADEYMTFPICMLGLPPSPIVLGIAFVTNRLCDIIKPPPARGFQRFQGGFGIVVDDVIACLYSLALNHVLYRLLLASAKHWS